MGSHDNVRQGELAIEQYQKVMELDPSNMKATKGAAYLNLQMKRFNTARRLYRKASEIDPNDPEPIIRSQSSIGRNLPATNGGQGEAGFASEQPMIQFPECWQFKMPISSELPKG